MVAEWEIQISYEGWLFALAVGQLVLLGGLWVYLTWRDRRRHH